MKYHIVYLTKNLITKKYYLGIHSTNNIDDGYLGSGILFRKIIRQYGKKNFERIVLFECESRKEALWIERFILPKWFIRKWGNGKKFYNQCRGGLGGYVVDDKKYKQLLLNKYDGRFINTEEYKSWYEEIEHKCNICGGVRKIKPSILFMKENCTICNKLERERKKQEKEEYLKLPIYTCELPSGISFEIKAIKGINKQGEIIKFDSVTQASKILGVNKSNISNCLNGKQKTSAGYIWREVDKEFDNLDWGNLPKCKQVKYKNLLTGKELIFLSINEASRATKVDRKRIVKHCKGEVYNPRKYAFEYLS